MFSASPNDESRLWGFAARSFIILPTIQIIFFRIPRLNTYWQQALEQSRSISTANFLSTCMAKGTKTFLYLNAGSSGIELPGRLLLEDDRLRWVEKWCRSEKHIFLIS